MNALNPVRTINDQIVEAIRLHAPGTRPGRFTIIESADLDEGSATSLVRRIWAD